MENLQWGFSTHVKENNGILYLPAICTKVIDGDTIIVDKLAIPFVPKGVILEPRIRLKDIDAYELNSKDEHEKELAIKAKAYLIDRLLGREVILELSPSNTYGTFTRILAYVYDGDENVCNNLLLLGMVKKYGS